jgi:hypothetical protein
MGPRRNGARLDGGGGPKEDTIVSSGRRYASFVSVFGAAAIALSTTLLAPQAGRAAPASAPPGIGNCPVFPANNIWNTPIDTLPVHAQSSAWVSSIGASTALHPDFGSEYEGEIAGIPYTVVPGSTPPVSITFDYDDESDRGPYRIPPDAKKEGGDDEHVLIIDRDACSLAEVFEAAKVDDTTWTGGGGAVFDLRSNALRPETWTSADAAGLPIFPGLVRYDEVAAGEIAHALRFTVQRSQRAYLWPARHYASSNTDPNLPPMGARARLKANVDITDFSPEVQVILRAMQKYGMFMADNGSNWFVSGAPDPRWNNDTLRELKKIVGSNLEFVDESSLMVHPESGEARTPTGASAPAQPQAKPQPQPQANPQPSQSRACDLDAEVVACPNANLEGADLTGLYLDRADLRGANLRGAALVQTILTDADLEGADLTGANLDTATLTRANLRGAILVRANLFSADVGEVDFTGATFRETICPDGSMTDGPACP